MGGGGRLLLELHLTSPIGLDYDDKIHKHNINIY